MKVTLVMALTVDGKIGLTDSHFPDWTGSEDKKMFKRVSTEAGVIIMGSKTFDAIGKPLPGRENIVLTRRFDRVSSFENLMFTGENPHVILKDLEKRGYTQVVLAGGSQINTIFARQKLIDELLITYSPLTFGHGLSLFSEKVDLALELLDLSTLGANTVLARYKVIYPAE
ncbi:MAG: dihydrofolate reductase [Desulfobacteraceae bacterium]|nr:dihydrofolate reductase [Desulfobacteraceae bacterium]